MERQIPKAGEFYRHFKDKMYQIIAVATHTETREAMVVYQALYGSFSVYVRPLEMFLSEVDREKYPLERYPQYAQKYRFEKVVLNAEENMIMQENTGKEEKKDIKKESKKETKQETKKKEQVQEETFVARNMAEAYMLKFLDATTYKERIEILDMMKPCCTENILQNLAISLDINISEKELESQFVEFRKALGIRMKYEASRLRE